MHYRVCCFSDSFSDSQIISFVSFHFSTMANGCKVHMFSHNENVSVPAVKGDRSLHEFKRFLHVDENI